MWWATDDTIDLRTSTWSRHDGPAFDREGLRKAIARLFERRLDRETVRCGKSICSAAW